MTDWTDDDADADWSGEDWSDEDWSDDDGDDNDDDDDEAVACPECGRFIHSVSDKCPACGYWLTDADNRSLGRGESRPTWQRATAGIMLLVFIICLILAGMMIF